MRLARISPGALLLLLAMPAPADDTMRLRFIGEQAFANRSLTFEDTTPGGLSGIDYDPKSGHYLVISDDQSVPGRGDARFYTVELDFDAESFSGFAFTSVTSLLRPDGSPFPEAGVDPEAIRLLPSGNLLWSSEGLEKADPQIAPFVREMKADGAYVRDLRIPERFFPTPDDATGSRHNLVFESLTLTPDGRWAVTATEGALRQDSPEATPTQGSPSRVLYLDLATGEPGPEYVYENDPVADATDGYTVAGLVELLALEPEVFLALERSFSAGFSHVVKIHRFDATEATDVSAVDSLAGADYVAGTKTLVADLTRLGITLYNLEGLTFGPQLATGNPSLVLVADDNFGGGGYTQFLVFEVLRGPREGP